MLININSALIFINVKIVDEYMYQFLLFKYVYLKKKDERGK